MSPAEEYAPALRTREPQYRQDPAEIGRVSHGPLQGDEKPVEFGHVEGFVQARLGRLGIIDAGTTDRLGHHLTVRIDQNQLGGRCTNIYSAEMTHAVRLFEKVGLVRRTGL